MYRVGLEKENAKTTTRNQTKLNQTKPNQTRVNQKNQTKQRQQDSNKTARNKKKKREIEMSRAACKDRRGVPTNFSTSQLSCPIILYQYKKTKTQPEQRRTVAPPQCYRQGNRFAAGINERFNPSKLMVFAQSTAPMFLRALGRPSPRSHS